MTITDLYSTATDRAKAAFPVLNIDLAGATVRYVQYVREGLEVNLELSRRAVESASSLFSLATDSASLLATAVRGHGHAISTWIADETELLSPIK